MMKAMMMMAALLWCAVAMGHEDRLTRMCEHYDLTPDWATEYSRDPKAHADNFCALWAYEPDKALKQLSKALASNRARLNQNRHYFNPQLRPDADYIQMHRPWMEREGWQTHHQGNMTDGWHSFSEPVRLSGMRFAHDVAAFSQCDTDLNVPPCVSTRIARLRESWAGDLEDVDGAWSVWMGWAWHQPVVAFATPSASVVKCAVEAALDAREAPRNTFFLTLRDDMQDAVEGCLGENDRFAKF